MRISDWSSDVCSSDLPDHQCEQGFHYGASGWVVARGASCRCARIDWCASAVRISRVAPTTTISTPRSKKVALGRCTSPLHGRFACTVWLVRNGKPKRTEPGPVTEASRTEERRVGQEGVRQ